MRSPTVPSVQGPRLASSPGNGQARGSRLFRRPRHGPGAGAGVAGGADRRTAIRTTHRRGYQTQQCNGRTDRVAEYRLTTARRTVAETRVSPRAVEGRQFYQLAERRLQGRRRRNSRAHSQGPVRARPRTAAHRVRGRTCACVASIPGVVFSPAPVGRARTYGHGARPLLAGSSGRGRRRGHPPRLNLGPIRPRAFSPLSSTNLEPPWMRA
jgi:hypothetical protein